LEAISRARGIAGKAGGRGISPGFRSTCKSRNNNEGGMKNVYLQCLFFTNAHGVQFQVSKGHSRGIADMPHHIK